MIRRCHSYTLRETCPVCGSKTRTAHPPRFAAEDRYGKYRRMARASQSS